MSGDTVLCIVSPIPLTALLWSRLKVTFPVCLVIMKISHILSMKIIWVNLKIFTRRFSLQSPKDSTAFFYHIPCHHFVYHISYHNFKYHTIISRTFFSLYHFHIFQHPLNGVHLTSSIKKT